MILFLDFDGVLVHSEYNPAGKLLVQTFDPRCIKVLHKLCRPSEDQIVISSAWRHYDSLCKLRELLKASGVQMEVIDVTPIDKFENRGKEILAWLQEHGLNKNSNYLIIDDELQGMDNWLPKNKILHIVDGWFCGGLSGLKKGLINEFS